MPRDPGDGESIRVYETRTRPADGEWSPWRAGSLTNDPVCGPETTTYACGYDCEDRIVEYVPASQLSSLQSARDEAVERSWIACSERMPDSSNDVLFVVAGERLARLGAHDGEIWIDAGNDDFMPGDVTHWMPLPEPPTPTGPGSTGEA